ncbi:hypothetical protein EDD18DRAFT_1111626 [Armillaria luteobubalina]|uniref:Uncharacterized protein n=1 Tax=Armillaria luteobubalina TaxID=153913 RepID=A0AA39PLB0_9AGAR|nr:hypothetical protein EDD18DRAFT_1111626 [Armillaria luteobubalina]
MPVKFRDSERYAPKRRQESQSSPPAGGVKDINVNGTMRVPQQSFSPCVSQRSFTPYSETKQTERKQREPATSQRRSGGRSGPHHHQQNQTNGTQATRNNNVAAQKRRQE